MPFALIAKETVALQLQMRSFIEKVCKRTDYYCVLIKSEWSEYTIKNMEGGKSHHTAPQKLLQIAASKINRKNILVIGWNFAESCNIATPSITLPRWRNW